MEIHWSIFPSAFNVWGTSAFVRFKVRNARLGGLLMPTMGVTSTLLTVTYPAVRRVVMIARGHCYGCQRRADLGVTTACDRHRTDNHCRYILLNRTGPTTCSMHPDAGPPSTGQPLPSSGYLSYQIIVIGDTVLSKLGHKVSLGVVRSAVRSSR